MLALALALLAGAADPPAPAQPPPHAVSGVVVTPLTRPPPADVKQDMGGADRGIEQEVVIWPGTAYTTRLDGRVSLRCRIDVHGLAEYCEVVAESPTGKGFGKAALELRPTFKLTPQAGPDGRPIAATKVIAITFKPPDDSSSGTEGTKAAITSMKDFDAYVASMRGYGGAGLPMRKVTMLDNPVWTAAATYDEVLAAYPAAGDGQEGYAVAHCPVRRTGALQDCFLIKETPEGHGFGRAALALTAKFHIAPEVARTSHSAPLWVDVPIRFAPPGSEEVKARLVMAPIWLSGVDPLVAPRLFPPEAAAQGLTTGRGVARCSVGPDGALTACLPEPGDPEGLGFSEAAVKLASTMRMNLWSLDGAPVAGGVIHIPIRLNLKTPPATKGN
jgi:TonB family protein